MNLLLFFAFFQKNSLKLLIFCHYFRQEFIFGG
jgi:hypothetical protein